MSMISIQMESGHPDAALVIIQDAKVKFDDIFDTIEKDNGGDSDFPHDDVKSHDDAERRKPLL